MINWKYSVIGAVLVVLWPYLEVLGFTEGVWQVQDALDDPWVTNRSCEEQARVDWHEWIHSYFGV